MKIPCEDTRYENEDDAIKNNPDKAPYPCAVCEGWHVTSNGLYVVVKINIISGLFMPCAVFTKYEDADKYALFVNNVYKDTIYCIASGAVPVNPGVE